MISSKNGLLETASFTPFSLQAPDAWCGHLHFAAWLIRNLEPKIFIELGTHTGNSYFSFCQSVKESDLATKCYAVDTWQGDEHAGNYGNEVFNQVNAHNQEHYATFSRLLRMTFDDALSYFSDGSVNLLHIDGLHTYEAVKHDFETWLPKLAPDAVVLFHDTNVRERGFGVWKLWEELQVSYPSNIEFLHSHGLGVLQLDGAAVSKKLVWLDSDSVEQQQLKDYFSALGKKQLERFELGQANIDVTNLTQAVTDLTQAVTDLTQAVTERDRQIAGLTDETVRRGEWVLRLDAELNEANAKLHTITQSNSWQITLPLREIRRWISTPKQQTKRYIRGGLRFAKGAYQSLPLSYQTKASHRRAIAKLFPKLLLLSGSYPGSIPALAIPQNQYAKNPLVSVIIPIYGKIEYTMQCLASIGKNPPQMPFEVIVVDDCSPDNSVEVLERVRGVRVIRNAENQGFIRSCNIGANVAKGEYLCFLNNDTEVAKEWLDELLRTFSEFPGTGLVGSKLVYPDGRLQEAGAIIWQDGSAWNFGRCQDPLLPVYNYAREVDYCSGASIMVPKSLFMELGGFDEHYLPAYCEDSDLALKVRDKGYRVIYQPLSAVIHYEGITSGTDTTQGTKAYQVVNSKKLFERWKDRLKAHQAPGENVDTAKDRVAKRRVLVLDHCTPTPDQDSGSIDAYNQMLLLREMDFQVTFIPEENFLFMPRHTSNLQRAGVEMLYAPYVTSVRQHLEEYGSRYNLVLISRPGTFGRNIKLVRQYCPKAKILFHTVDLHFLRLARQAESMKKLELSYLAAADISTVVSTKELEIAQQEIGDEKVRLLPFARSIQGTKKPFQQRKDIIFVGGFKHEPNVDAVKYFVEEVMPMLRKKLHGVRFYVVGSNTPSEIQALASEDIIIAGYVEDLTHMLDKMRVSVAPLRYGAGIKGKIGTAMAVGLPVVATTLAAEGMSLTDSENILVANEAEAFALAVTRLYDDEALWSKLSKAGVEFAEQAWGAEASWGILANILADIDIASKRSANKLTLYSGMPSTKVER